MKRALLIGVFVFSLLLNLTVASILGWHYWSERKNLSAPVTECPMLNETDFKQISQVWSRQERSGLQESRRLIRDKQAELIEQIGKTPGELGPSETTIRELMSLREKMEREALARLSNALVQLPEEKREALVSYVKHRSCMGPGMRFGGGRMGRGRMMQESGPEGAIPGTQ